MIAKKTIARQSISREAKVKKLEKDLYPLYFEISVLKRRVEDVHPKGGSECCQVLHALVDQYRAVEAMIQSLRENGDQAFEDAFAAVERRVDELVQRVAAQSPWIMLQIADRFSPVY